MKGDGDIMDIFEASLGICLILTFCGTTKKEWLLGNSYFKYFKLVENCRRMLLRNPTP
jgi:hypothetical protein